MLVRRMVKVRMRTWMEVKGVLDAEGFETGLMRIWMIRMWMRKSGGGYGLNPYSTN